MSDMEPPENITECIFAERCESQEGGQPQGDQFCQYCKNRGFNYIKQTAGSDPRLQEAVRKYDIESTREADALAQRNQYVCAIKRPIYRNKPWRHEFNPDRITPCTDPVNSPGELCTRCQISFRAQLARDPDALPELEDAFPDGRVLGYPCVFVDPYFNHVRNNGWRLREKVVPGSGRHSVVRMEPLRGWFPPLRAGVDVATTPFQEQYCVQRVGGRGRLCANCFNRLVREADAELQYQAYFELVVSGDGQEYAVLQRQHWYV